MVILPCAKGFSERITKILRCFNIKVVHKPIRESGFQWNCVYIRQTSCALKTRVKEHAKAIAILDENSLLAKHHMCYSHQIDLVSVEIVDRSSAWREILILEAWHSVRDTNAIKEHIALSDFESVFILERIMS